MPSSLQAHTYLTRILSLTEAGRVLSAANLAKAKTALAALQALLTSAGADDADDADEAQQESAIAEARELLEAELSHNEVQQALRNALKAQDPTGKRYFWPREVFDAYFVYEDEGPLGGEPTKLFKRTYVIADDGKVTLGDPVEVRARTEYVAVAEARESALEVAGDFIPLVEKAVRRDGTVPLKLIQPGWGSSGYYGAEMLERDGPKVFTKGTKMYWDHPTTAEEAERPERSLRDLAAELTGDARWDAKGAAGPGLYADAKVFKGFKESVEELAPHIGVSIRALGKGKTGEVEGKTGKVIESIVAAKSVDFVTAPGAGGQVLQLFEAARGGRAEPIPPTEQTPKEGPVTISEAEVQELREREAQTQTTLQEMRREMQQLQQANLLREAREIVVDTLRQIEMPDTVRARLQEQDHPVIKDGAIDREATIAKVKEAAAAELRYLRTVNPTGVIRGMGSVDVSEGGGPKPTPEQTDAALEEAFRGIGLGSTTAKLAAVGR